MIEVNSISFRYRNDWVLRDLSLQIGRGEFLGVIGPNGSGKTTLLKILCRLLSPQHGSVLFEGLPLEKMTRSEIAKQIAVVPQESYTLYPFLVMEIVLMGRTPYLGHLMFERPRDLEIARRAMEWTETLSISDRSIDEISGGERRRVLIARALAQEPKVILLDEPTANLDLHHQVEFLNLLLTLNREKGLTIFMASHDLNIAAEFCDRLILLQKGGIFRAGTPSEVITRENIESVYGCEVCVDPHPVTGVPTVHPLKRKGVR